MYKGTIEELKPTIIPSINLPNNPSQKYLNKKNITLTIPKISIIRNAERLPTFFRRIADKMAPKAAPKVAIELNII